MHRGQARARQDHQNITRVDDLTHTCESEMKWDGFSRGLQGWGRGAGRTSKLAHLKMVEQGEIMEVHLVAIKIELLQSLGCRRNRVLLQGGTGLQRVYLVEENLV